MGRFGGRAVGAVAVFIGWLFVTEQVGRLWQSTPSLKALSISVEPGYLAAIAFLAIVIAACGWRDIGLTPPRPPRSILLLWFPGCYIAVFFVALGFIGPPSPSAMLAILVNAMLAGVSEELACRGVLYQGLRSRLSIWPAILLSTALFAAVHLVNGFVFGSFTLAAVQAVAAFETGIAFMAIRIRTNSLYPGMILHGVWDFSLLALTSKAIDQTLKSGASLGEGLTAGMLLLPVLAVMPNFLYGLFLLRRAGRDQQALSGSL